jgi:NADH-quinone oxidoreductase subunit H
VVGLLAGWVDRKVTARLQWRVGPPWYQNFVDLIKLCGKEIIIPEGAKNTFLLAPLLGILSLGLAAAILGVSISSPLRSFTGDLIVVLYLLMMPAIALVMGASSSRNPLASVGASREMKLILGYELPFLLSVATVIIKTGGNIRLGEIVNYQAGAGSVVFSASGAIAFCVAIVCMQAKIGFAPFEISEADQEIMAGVLIEYSGLPLAVFKLTKAIMLYTMPVFLSVLFLGKDLSPAFMVLKYVMLLVVIILVKNTNPRIRIDQALRFFWGPLTVIAVIGLVLAVFKL